MMNLQGESFSNSPLTLSAENSLTMLGEYCLKLRHNQSDPFGMTNDETLSEQNTALIQSLIDSRYQDHQASTTISSSSPNSFSNPNVTLNHLCTQIWRSMAHEVEQVLGNVDNQSPSGVVISSGSYNPFGTTDSDNAQIFDEGYLSYSSEFKQFFFSFVY